MKLWREGEAKDENVYGKEDADDHPEGSNERC